MFRDALNYPRQGKDLERTYIIGTLLGLGSILILPAFILLGYLTRAMSKTLKGEEEIPVFNNYTELFIDGLKLTGVMLSYMAGAILVIAALNQIGSATGLRNISSALGLSVLLLAIYIIPSAIVEFAGKSRMVSAFRLKEILDQAFTRRYLKGMLLLIGTSILIGIMQIVVMILLTITIIGIPALIFVIPAMRFYENLVYFRMMANMTE